LEQAAALLDGSLAYAVTTHSYQFFPKRADLFPKRNAIFGGLKTTLYRALLLKQKLLDLGR
jgi:hypothetical protein